MGMSYDMLIAIARVGILMFIIQFICCLKAKRINSKLTPVYITLFFAVIAVAIYIGVIEVFWDTGLGVQQIYAILLIMRVVAALVGDALAWIAYGILLKIKG